MSATLLESALEFAALGWRVLPLVPGEKRPHGRLVPRGHRDASTDPARLCEWWGRVPRANVGVVAGPESFDALDVDGPQGFESLRLLSGGARFTTRTHKTPRGFHFLFAPGTLGTSASKLGAGLDTRGASGGYVVAPPSVLASGAAYRLAVRAELAEVPLWLVERANGRVPQGRTLAESEALVRVAPVGTRDATLNREAFLRAKDAPSERDAERAAARLVTASTLPRAEAERVGHSALAAGLKARARMRARFRRVPVVLTRDPRFRGRSAEAKLLALLVCTGEGATAIPGVAVASPRSLAQEASLSEEVARRALRELAVARLLRSDVRSGLLWLDGVTALFRPENPNVARAWRAALDFAIPRCALGREIEAAVSKTESRIPPRRALKRGMDTNEGPAPAPATGTPATDRNRKAGFDQPGIKERLAEDESSTPSPLRLPSGSESSENHERPERMSATSEED